MKTSFYTLILLVLCSCAQNDKMEAMMELNEEQQNLYKIKEELASNESLLTQYAAELEVAKEKLSDAKDFHILRMPNEKEEDIRQAALGVNTIQKNIEMVSKKVRELSITTASAENRIDQLKATIGN